MFEINLLPWRNEKRKHVIYKLRLSILFGVIAGIIFWTILHVELSNYNKRVTKKIAVLEKLHDANQAHVLEIKQLKHQYEQWVERANFLDEVQSKQKAMFELFAVVLLLTELPARFNEITFTPASAIFKGRAHSIETLGLFMRKLAQKTHFSSIKIKKIYRLSTWSDYRFEVAAQ